MNKLTFKSITWAIALFVFLLVSCKEKSSTTPDPAPAKTLNRSTIAPKIWYTQGSSIVHDLKAGGVYGSMNGTWKWRNNSDTMEIVTKAGFPSVDYKVYWNTETEMSAQNTTTKVTFTYKDHAW
jgi:hypothetical protein